MAQERVAYINGDIVPESQARVSINDRGFLYGDAVFDTARTFGHRIFKLGEHLDRLYSSLKYMRIDPGLTRDAMADRTMQVLEANLPLSDEDDDYWVTQRVTRVIIEYAAPPMASARPSLSSVIRCRSPSGPCTTGTAFGWSRRPSGGRPLSP